MNISIKKYIFAECNTLFGKYVFEFKDRLSDLCSDLEHLNQRIGILYPNIRAAAYCFWTDRGIAFKWYINGKGMQLEYTVPKISSRSIVRGIHRNKSETIQQFFASKAARN